jgi:flagellar M-ring protein FliF
VFNRVREWWEGLGRNNQIILGASSLGVIIALIGFITWANTPEYVPLFSNLSAQDANAITDKLNQSNVPYRLLPGGSAIEVPAQKRDEVRMKLISQGLPQQQSSVMPGYELLDNISAFQTQPMEAMTMLRAKEGEISKSIMSLQQVGSATIHYAPADDSPYATDKHPASASVIVTLKPGQELTKENVRAIVQLTQMPYTGLTEKNISVVDSTGKVHWDGPHADSADSNERRDKERAFAQERREELQRLLDKALGQGNAVVTVNAEMNNDVDNTESVIPEAGVPVSKTVSTEQLTGAGAVSGAAPGTTANVTGTPGTPAVGAAAPGTPAYARTTDANGQYKREETATNYQAGVTKRTITRAPGRLEKLTVSALVDSKATSPDGKTKLDLASIKQILETNVGVTAGDATRVVTVAEFPFNRTAEDAALKDAERAHTAETYAKIISVAVPLGLMLLCFVLLARALRKPMRLVPGGPQLALASAGGMSGSFNADGTPMMMMGPDGTPVPAQVVDGVLVPDNGPIALTSHSGPRTYEVIEEAFDADLESILHMTKSKPETVAVLIKSWISEDQN